MSGSLEGSENWCFQYSTIQNQNRNILLHRNHILKVITLPLRHDSALGACN